MKKPAKLYTQPLKMPIPLSPEEKPEQSFVMQEAAASPSLGEIISVRAAKAHLSGLLELVARGREIIITSNGKPKARLISAEEPATRQPFAFSPGYTPAPWRGGLTADDVIRADRDGRDW